MLPVEPGLQRQVPSDMSQRTDSEFVEEHEQAEVIKKILVNYLIQYT